MLKIQDMTNGNSRIGGIKMKIKISRYLKIFLFVSILIMTDFAAIDNAYANETKTITISESMIQSRSQEITIPKLKSMNNITVSTGNVDYAVDGEKITINVKNGAHTKSIYNPKKYSKPVSYTKTLSSYPSSKYSYNIGGYIGTLNLNNVTTSATTSYTTRYFKYVTEESPRHSGIRDNPPPSGLGSSGVWKLTNEGYNNVEVVDVYWTSDVTTRKVGHAKPQTEWTRHYAVKCSYGDTQYNGHYTGTAYKGGDDLYYGYTITLEYTLYSSPEICVEAIETVLSDKFGYNEIAITGNVKDNDINDNLTIYYTIEDSTGNPVIGHNIVDIDSFLADGNIQSFNKYIISIDDKLPEGNYTIKIWCEDDKLGKSNEVIKNFKVDKTGPNVNAPIINAISDTEIEIRPNSSDSSGLMQMPYLYNKDGEDISQWTAANPYNDRGLEANTQYSYKYKAIDIIDNESEYSPVSKAYTLALNPENIEIASSDGTSITFEIRNAKQGEAPEHKLELKLKGIGPDGANVVFSDWGVETTRTLNGVSKDTEYELWVTTRNGDRKENTKYLAIGTLTSNIPPNVIISDSTAEQIANSSGMITIAGKAWDGDGDNLTVNATIDGVTKTITINNAPDIEPQENNYTLIWTAEELKDEIYSNVIINVRDDSIISATNNSTYTGNLIVDKVEPSAIISGNTIEWTNKDIILNVNASDITSGVKRIQNPDQTWTDGANMVYTVTDNGDYSFVIEDKAGNITRVTENVGMIDKTKPQITGIYTYKGILYVLGEDSNLLNSKPYGFEFLEDANTCEELISENLSGFEVTVSADSKVAAGTKIFKQENSISVELPVKLRCILRDIVPNKDEVSIIIDHPNKVFCGTVPQDVLDKINAQNTRSNKNSSEKETDVIIVDDIMDEEMKKAIEETLDNTKVEKIDTPLNSNTGRLEINIGDTFGKLKNLSGIGYRIDIVQKETLKLVYTKIVNNPEVVEIPKLEDSTTYIVRLSIITNGRELAFREIEKTTADRTAPVVEMVRVYNNTLEIRAKDNLMLAEKAYKYDLVDGKIFDEEKGVSLESFNGIKVKSLGEVASLTLTGLNLNDNWSFDSWTSKNRIGVDEGSKLKISVRDSQGNYTETVITANEGNLHQLLNPDDPHEIKVGTGLKVDNLISTILKRANKSNEIINEHYYLEINSTDGEITNNRLVIRKRGQIVITLINKITGEKLQYLMEAKEDNEFKRRIIVQKDSRTSISRAFDYALYTTFHTLGNIEFTAENEYVKIEENEVVRAVKNGIGVISARKDNKELILYIVVNDSIVSTQSNIETFKDNIGYTILKGREVDILKQLDLYGTSNRDVVEDYIVIEHDDRNLLEVNGTKIKGLKTGVTTIRIIDLINKVVRIVNFEVVELSKVKSDYTDIINHWAEEEIRDLSDKGLIGETQSDEFRPDDYMTYKEFFVMLNRFKLLSGYKDEKIVKDLKINKSDEKYYTIYNSIMGLTNHELKNVFGEYPDYNKEITREEAAYFIARIFDDALVAGDDMIEFEDVREIKYEKELKTVITNSIFTGYDDNTLKPTKYISKAEMAKVITRLLKVDSI